MVGRLLSMSMVLGPTYLPLGSTDLAHCCCTESHTEVFHCLEEVASSPAGSYGSGVLVVKVVGPSEVTGATCSVALWARKKGYEFTALRLEGVQRRVGVKDVSSDSQVLTRLRRLLEEIPAHVQWLAIFGEHVMPMNSHSDPIRKVSERILLSTSMENLHVIASRPSMPQQAGIDIGPSVSMGIWFLRHSDFSLRLLHSLSREVVAGVSLSDAFVKANGKLPQYVALWRSGELAGTNQGLSPSPVEAQAFLQMADYPVPVRAAAARASVQQLCKTPGAPPSTQPGTEPESAAVLDDSAVGVYHALLESLQDWVQEHPEEVRHGLQLVQLLEFHGRRSEALSAAAAALQVMPPPEDARESLLRASLYAQLGNHEAALSDCHRASFTEARRADALSCMAAALHSTGRSAEASTTLRSVLVLASESDDKFKTANAMSSLTNAYAAQGKLQEAEKLGMRALRLHRDLFSEDHPNLVAPLNALADVWRMQQRTGESLRGLQQILKIQRGALPADHPDIGSQLNNLGYLLMEEKRYEESFLALKAALRIGVSALGLQHDAVAGTLFNLAAVHELQGEHPAALRVYERMDRLRTNAGEPAKARDGRLLGRHGRLLHQTGRHAEALDKLREALAVWRAVQQQPDEEVLSVAGAVGAVLHALERRDEAADVLQGVAGMQERAHGAQSPEAAQTFANLGVVLHAMGRNDEAVMLLRRSEEGILRALGPADPQYHAVHENLLAITQRTEAITSEVIRESEVIHEI